MKNKKSLQSLLKVSSLMLISAIVINLSNFPFPNIALAAPGPQFCGFSIVAGGDFSSLAIKNDGTVWAWGYNDFGQLGNNSIVDSNIPIQVQEPTDPTGFLTNVIQITENGDHAMALKSDGTVWAWGYNSDGELGIGNNTDSHVAVQVTDPSDGSGFLQNVNSISNGRFHSLAAKNDGTVWAWGLNTDGELGQGTTGGSSNVPIQVTDPSDGSGFLQNVYQVSGGRLQSYALTNSGTVKAWGYNNHKELGDGDTTLQNVPVDVVVGRIPAPLNNIAAISAGRQHVLALDFNGNVWAWGTNLEGELGIGTTSSNEDVSEVTDPSDGSGFLSNVTSISAGRFHSMALKDDNTVWTWGSNTNGQLGSDTPVGTTSLVPAEVTESSNFFSGAVAIAAGNTHSMAVKTDGTVWTWGANSNGQLGNATNGTGGGTDADQPNPVQISFTLNCVSPNSGSDAGGTTVTISGAYFTLVGMTVTFDGLSATNVTFIDSNTITADTPAHAAGAVDVVISDGRSSSTLTNGFTYTSGSDSDGDGVPDSTDNCPTVPNPGQENTDGPGSSTNLTNMSNSDESEPKYSPDGTKIAYSSYSYTDSTSDIYIMDSDGRNQLDLTNTPTTSEDAPFFSPDGTKIYFESQPSGSRFDVYSINSDGSGVTNLTNDPGFNDGIVGISPDGTKIYFFSDRDGNDEIYSMDSNGTNQTNLTNTALGSEFRAVVSADGTKIAYASDSGSGNKIFIMDADGTNQTQLTTGTYNDYPQAFSPDGTKILFISDRNGPDEIFTMDVNGSNQTSLTPAAVADAPTYSPDGTKIAFYTNPGGNDEIYIMDSDGGNQTNLSVAPASNEDNPIFNPDGTKVAFISYRDGNGEIYSTATNPDTLGDACDCQTDGLCTAETYCANNSTPDTDCYGACGPIASNESCASTTIQAGTLSFTDIPDNTAFTNAQNNTNLPSFNNAGGADAMDTLSVSDLRDDAGAGFEVQLSASPFATADNANTIPLDYLYVVSTLPRNSGTIDDTTNGIEYAADCSGPTNDITGSVNADSAGGPPDLGALSTFSVLGSTLGTGDTTTPVVLMSAPAAARRCTASQNISYAVDLPSYISAYGSNIPAGTYTVTFTFTLIPT